MTDIKTKPEVVRGRTELRVFPQGNQVTFIHPYQGPGNYQTVGQNILRSCLSLPTGEQTAYLVQGAYESEEKEFKEVQEIMENRLIWVFNRNVWTAEGVYVARDPQAIGVSQDLIESELESMLNGGTEVNGVRYSQDSNVRFAPRETYKVGEHTPESLASDGFIVASFGVNGAKALAEVAERFKRKPYVYGIEVRRGESSKQRVSALSSDWDIDRRLYVYGDYLGGNRGGCAFGV